MPVPGQIIYGTVLTGDQYLNCESTRQRLLSELDGKAIEMEGGAVAQVCEAFGLPWLGHPRTVRPRRRKCALRLHRIRRTGIGDVGHYPEAAATRPVMLSDYRFS